MLCSVHVLVCVGGHEPWCPWRCSPVGGVFSRQAEVIFQPGNERLNIKQQFKGIDTHDHLVVSTELEGRLPPIPLGSSVQINPYQEIYQYDSNCKDRYLKLHQHCNVNLFSLFSLLLQPVITSSSNRDYTITSPDGTVHTRSYQWRQTITFQSCPHNEVTRAAPSTQQLSVDQIFVMFDADNNLTRYAMSNKIGSVHSEFKHLVPAEELWAKKEDIYLSTLMKSNLWRCFHTWTKILSWHVV